MLEKLAILALVATLHSNVPSADINSFVDKSFTVDKKYDYSKYQNVGFKGEILNYKTNLDDLDIHTTQYSTGQYWMYNCGPSAVRAALKWYYRGPVDSVEKIRSEITDGTHGVYTDEIEDYLYNHNIPYSSSHVDSVEDLKSVIDKGYVAILCLNASYLNGRQSYSSQIGRTYIPDAGHCILLTGYVETTDELYFETMDSLDLYNSSLDGYKKARYYNGENTLKAVVNWYSWTINIQRNTQESTYGSEVQGNN